jgi:predicted nucleic acid-binding protein
MSGDFIDSNVIVYRFDSHDIRKQAVAVELLRNALAASDAAISFQVVQEVLNTVTRRLTPPFNADEARQLLSSVLVPLWRVMPTPALYERALDTQSRFRYSFYDSLIIAAALEAGCTRLLSEDLQAGQNVDGLRIEDPFASAGSP